MKPNIGLLISLASLVLVVGASPSHAAPSTWNNAGPTNNWSTVAGNENWSGGLVWTNGDSAIFGNTAEAGVTATTTNIVDDISFDASWTIGNGIAASINLTTDGNSNITVSPTFSSSIGEIISGTNVVTKLGTGTLTLTNANTYSAGTTISAGTLIASGSGTTTVLGSGAVAVGSTLRINQSATTTFQVANTLTGAGTIEFSSATAATAGTRRTQVTGNISGFTGDFHVLSGGNFATWNSGATAAIASTTQAVTVDSGGFLAILSATGTPITTSFGALNGMGTVTTNGPGAGAYLSTLSIGNGGASGSFGGNITQISPVTVSVTKNGAGTQTLSGANTYTGATTVSGGKLSIASTGTINGTSGVSIGAGEFNYNSSTALTKTVSFSGSGGTLSGSGTINNSVNVTTGNSLAIGNNPGAGTMNFGTNLAIGGTYLYELVGGTSSADLGNVGGNLTLGGILDLVQLGTYTAGNKYTLLSYFGTLAGTFTDVSLVTLNDGDTFTDAGGLWQIDYNDTAGLNGGNFSNFVTITAVPEPAAALLGSLGLLALLRRRR